MKIGYGTWALQQMPLEEVIPGLMDIGFDAVSLAVAPDSPTAPENLGDGERKRYKALFRKHKLPAPVIGATLAPLVQDDERAEMVEQFREVCRLAKDLHYGPGSAIVTTALGLDQPEWESGKNLICKRLFELAKVAAQ